MTLKLIAAWIVGGLFLLSAIWIIANLELTLGVSPASYAIAILVSLGLILGAGVLWISVAVATRHHD